MPQPGNGSVDVLGPVFLSYRKIDGARPADDLAWALQASGVPVWYDEWHMPPGDTTLRLKEALANGLSGAILVVTPDISTSRVVKEVELPTLLELERDPRFILAIASEINAEAGLDLDTPDQLLEQPPPTLRRLKQYPVATIDDIQRLVIEIVKSRMDNHAQIGRDPLVIDIQTRSRALAHSGLVVRTRPPEAGRRSPPPSACKSLKEFLARLPELVKRSGASKIQIEGCPHLSIAFALGAALPVTTRCTVDVAQPPDDVAQPPDVWGGQVEEPAVDVTEETGSTGPGRTLAVFLDLARDVPPVDTFGKHVDAEPARYAGTIRITVVDRERGIPAPTCRATADKVARMIKMAAATCQTTHLALFLRTPFPLAVHLGRLFNTFDVELYEWEDNAGPPGEPQGEPQDEYVYMATVASGRGGSPIVALPTEVAT